MGKISDLAYNIGTSLNQEDINTHRQAITPTAQTLKNLSTDEQLAYHAQNQALLDANQEQLKGEKDSGDGFWNNRYIPPLINTNNPNARRWNVNNNPHALTVRREIEVIRQTYPSFQGFSSARPINSPITREEAAEYTAFREFIRSGTNQTYRDINLALNAFREGRRPSSGYSSRNLNPNINLKPYNIQHDVNGNQVFYRALSPRDYQTLLQTGRVPATGETFISPSQAYSSNYNGVLIRFTVRPGTAESLLNIGVSGNAGTRSNYFPNMPPARSGWPSNNQAQFKLEQSVINTGLGQSRALEIFNENIIRYEVIQK